MGESIKWFSFYSWNQILTAALMKLDKESINDVDRNSASVQEFLIILTECNEHSK